MAAGKLFEGVLFVSQCGPDEEPSVTFEFGENLEKDVLSVVPLFCFPEGKSAISATQNREMFSFILTGGDGRKQMGYCRRFLDESSVPRCYCILSFVDSFSMFSSILEIIDERQQSGGSDSVICFLIALLSQPIPQPGETCTVSTFSDFTPNDLDRYDILNPLNDDFLLEYISFAELFSALGIDNVITLFECLLLECRIVFVSKTLGRLSACVSSAVALLNPFHWQYVFIPILPESLLSYCCAPMPFVVGVTDSSLPEINAMPTEEILVVHCDEGKFLAKPKQIVFFSDEMRIYLKKALTKISASFQKDDKMFDLTVARCFINIMYRLIGNYYKFMDSDGNFDTETFLEFQPPQFEQMVDILKNSQMWQGFLEERENWKKRELLDSCVLLKEAHGVWCVEDLSLTCIKCKKKFTKNGHTKKGKFYCHPCFESKFQLILEQKKLLESSSTKMKGLKKTISKKATEISRRSTMPIGALEKAQSTSSLEPKSILGKASSLLQSGGSGSKKRKKSNSTKGSSSNVTYNKKWEKEF